MLEDGLHRILWSGDKAGRTSFVWDEALLPKDV